MLIDSSTRRNLELCETLREKQKRGSLLWFLTKHVPQWAHVRFAKM